MHVANDWGAAAQAVERLLLDAYHVDIRKALDPLNQADFLTIVESIAGDLHGISGPVDAQAVDAAIKALDVDWLLLTDAQRAEVVYAANLAMRGIPAQVVPAVTSKLKLRLEEVVGSTRISAVARLGLDIKTSLDLVDQNVASSLAKIGQWVTDEYGRRVSMMASGADRIIAQGLAAGHRSADISKDLATHAQQIGIHRAGHYWRAVALNAANRSRSYGHLRSMAEGGIMNYVFTAVQDEHTTEICRQLDGVVFPVEAGLRRFSDLAVDTAGDATAAEKVMPFVQERRTTDGAIELFIEPPGMGRTVIGEVLERGYGRADYVPESRNMLPASSLSALGISMPPLHHCCRSTILPDV